MSFVYQAIAEHEVDKLEIKAELAHRDITSFHFDGEYGQFGDQDINTIRLVKGYSRDHRPELNQVVLELICENQAGLPVYMQLSAVIRMMLKLLLKRQNVIFIA